MTHDVQVDARGIAWVSGTGGTRGYHTSGLHRDPLTGGWRRATATRPVPYAGGAVPPADAPTTFTHNSLRPVGRTVADGPRPSRQHPPGSLLLHSEERFGTCQQDAKVVISSLRGSYDGESWRATPAKPFYLRTVSTWSPYGAEGYDPRAVCSAHYFSLSNRLLASAWFEQGTRILDLRDPARPVQIAFWRPPGTMAFEATWHRGRIYVADHALGVQILAVGPGRQGR